MVVANFLSVPILAHGVTDFWPERLAFIIQESSTLEEVIGRIPDQMVVGAVGWFLNREMLEELDSLWPLICDRQLDDPTAEAQRACYRGSVPTLQWMRDHGLLDLESPHAAERLLETACEGSLEVAQWVYEQRPTLDHCWNNYAAFRAACQHDRRAARWLYSLGGMEGLTGRGELFGVLVLGSLVDGQWFYGLGGIDREHLQQPWKSAVRLGKWETATWLYSLGLDPDWAQRTFVEMVGWYGPRAAEYLCRHGPGIDLELRDLALQQLPTLMAREGTPPSPRRLAEIAAVLIEEGANPALCGDWPPEGESILHHLRRQCPHRGQKSARSVAVSKD